MTDTLGQRVTSPETAPPLDFPPQGTMTIQQRADDVAVRAGFLRNQSALTYSDAADLQHDAFDLQLSLLTAELVKQDHGLLLDRLSGLGFSWRDIARLVGVSVPALRRWRSGDSPNGEHRRAIARLLAFVEIIGRDHLVLVEPAAWMEVPIVGAGPTTPIDLYAAGKLDVVLELASGNCSPEAAMDHADPGWREKYQSDWEVDVAEDGERYLRPKPGR